MRNRILGITGAVIILTLMASVAWAAPRASVATATDHTRPGGSSTTRPDGSSTSRPDGSSTSRPDGSSTTRPNNTTSTSIRDTTTSTIDDSTTTTVNNSTTTTIRSTTTTVGNSTTTTVGNSTTTTVDDNPGSGTATYAVGDVATVTISWSDGELSLVSVTTNAGWTIVKQELRPDRVRIEWENGDLDARFEAELKNGSVEVKIEVD